MVAAGRNRRGPRTAGAAGEQDDAGGRRALSVDAYNHIRTALIRSRYRMGQRLVLRPLAAELGLSPTPVREALLRLVSEQALELNDRNTAVVPDITQASFLEIHNLRVDLESRLVQAAALRAAPAEIEALSALNDSFLAACERHDEGSMAACNADFHALLATIADLPLTANILRSLWARVGPIYALARTGPPPRASGVAHPHDELLAALRARNPEEARQALVRDFEYARKWIEPLLPA
ncbi:GntR family transcriptional regulator [Gluconacetobacter johannae DSM 13595]|uniref:GntR family transcriptional regulator n=1 Tax=Gluconacetobacter johannae TaxID=112140 RepID=A0A7W4J4L3_9PROT|nr:GntR family transcriptional regulator [Gluconacetobacter johannae]MBB2174338.1 GntR family transcriptional regulator [Gluconacetobacter johannae]GBQ85249.1 GntR family transcriptional regulator [Gluconacetobacter johannae DSM 13595]